MGSSGPHEEWTEQSDTNKLSYIRPLLQDSCIHSWFLIELI